MAGKTAKSKARALKIRCWKLSTLKTWGSLIQKHSFKKNINNSYDDNGDDDDDDDDEDDDDDDDHEDDDDADEAPSQGCVRFPIR